MTATTTEQFVPCFCGCRCGAHQRCQACGACACIPHGFECPQPPIGEPMPLPEPESPLAPTTTKDTA